MGWRALWMVLLLAVGHSAQADGKICAAGPDPVYPPAAMRNLVEGDVHVVFSTDASGDFAQLKQISFSLGIPSEYREDFKLATLGALKTYQCMPNKLLSRTFYFKLKP